MFVEIVVTILAIHSSLTFASICRPDLLLAISDRIRGRSVTYDGSEEAPLSRYIIESAEAEPGARIPFTEAKLIVGESINSPRSSTGDNLLTNIEAQEVADPKTMHTPVMKLLGVQGLDEGRFLLHIIKTLEFSIQ